MEFRSSVYVHIWHRWNRGLAHSDASLGLRIGFGQFTFAVLTFVCLSYPTYRSFPLYMSSRLA